MKRATRERLRRIEEARGGGDADLALAARLLTENDFTDALLCLKPWLPDDSAIDEIVAVVAKSFGDAEAERQRARLLAQREERLRAMPGYERRTPS